MSPALAGGFLSTAPPGKSAITVFEGNDMALSLTLTKDSCTYKVSGGHRDPLQGWEMNVIFQGVTLILTYMT